MFWNKKKIVLKANIRLGKRLAFCVHSFSSFILSSRNILNEKNANHPRWRKFGIEKQVIQYCLSAKFVSKNKNYSNIWKIHEIKNNTIKKKSRKFVKADKIGVNCVCVRLCFVVVVAVALFLCWCVFASVSPPPIATNVAPRKCEYNQINFNLKNQNSVYIIQKNNIIFKSKNNFQKYR